MATFVPDEWLSTTEPGLSTDIFSLKIPILQRPKPSILKDVGVYMLLCLDVGNSHIYGGLFSQQDIVLRFRQTSKVSTSDEIGIFLKSVLRENACDPQSIENISICSVVPQLDYSLRSSCVKYFSIDPFFIQL